MSKDIAGSVLQSVAGPIDWLKKLSKFFDDANWVMKNLLLLIETEGEPA